MTSHDFELDLPQDLQDGLIAVGEAARDLDQPWWIFGGAAMALYGLTDLHVPDIDVLCAPRDARTLLAALGGEVMADPGEGKVYELWLERDGEMIAAGFMPEGPDNTVLLSGDAATADGVGITVEPEGGSTEPNLDSAVVLSFDA